MKRWGEEQTVYGASVICSAEAWLHPDVQEVTWDALRRMIEIEQGGTGTREFRQLTYGRFDEATEEFSQFIPTPEGYGATHVWVFLELSP